jgi:hypothetical protein
MIKLSEHIRELLILKSTTQIVFAFKHRQPSQSCLGEALPAKQTALVLAPSVKRTLEASETKTCSHSRVWNVRRRRLESGADVAFQTSCASRSASPVAQAGGLLPDLGA